MRFVLICLMGVFITSFVTPIKTKLDVEQTALKSDIFQETLQRVIFSNISAISFNHIENSVNEKVLQFLSTLFENGFSEISGNDEECRPVCVIAQGAIEDGLAKMLRSKELKSIKAIILTPLPPTPLRKKGNTIGLSNVSFDSARQYSLDMRECTLRELRDAGALIVTAYSRISYEELESKKDIGSLEQVKNWQEEKRHPLVKDIPLNINISDDVVGALYLITDNEDNKFYLPVQSIQAKSVTENTNTWKMWLVSNETKSEGSDRAMKMLKYIESHD